MFDRSRWTLTVVPSHEAMSRAADVIAETVRRSPDAVIAVPTGNTPLACCTQPTQPARHSPLDERGSDGGGLGRTRRRTVVWARRIEGDNEPGGERPPPGCRVVHARGRRTARPRRGLRARP